MRNAASVGCMPLPERTKIGSPDKSRKRLRAVETAGWCMPRRTAARDTLRSAITVCKTRIRCRSIFSKGVVSRIKAIRAAIATQYAKAT